MAKATSQHVIITGFLGKPPELRATQGGQAVASFSIATDEGYKDKAGQWVDASEWHRVVAWGELADYCAKEFAKGDLIQVEGKLKTREWEKDGVKHYTTEIVAWQARRFYYEKKQRNGNYAPPPDDAHAPANYGGRQAAHEDYDIGDLGDPLDLDVAPPLSPGD